MRLLFGDRARPPGKLMSWLLQLGDRTTVDVHEHDAESVRDINRLSSCGQRDAIRIEACLKIDADEFSCTVG